MTPSAVKDPLVGVVVANRYEVVRRIGKGGMGTVYEVTHRRLGRRFAMKTLSADLADDAEALARFQREADIVANLHHPHIVDVVDWEMLDDGSPCIVMEYLRGETLGARVKRTGPLDWPVLGRIADQVLSALSVAHRAGIVHRDLKPQNVFLARDDADDERAKLLDFGVSKVRDSRVTLTSQQQLLGTPAYMSPEQIEGDQEKIGPAADVWSMGAILFEMAAGRVAFAATSVPSFLYRICHGQPESLAEHRPDAPAPFVELVERALSRDPVRRITETVHLRRALRAALEPIAPGAFVDQLRADTGGDAGALTDVFEPVDPTLDSATQAATVVTPAPSQLHAHQQRARAMPTTPSRAASEATPVPQLTSMNVRPRYRAWLIGFLVVVALAGTTLLVASMDDEAPADESPIASEESTAVVETPARDAAAVTAPVAQAPPLDAATPLMAVPDAGAPDATAAPDPPPAPSKPRVRKPRSRKVRVVVTSKPKGATVYYGKRRLGKTPLNEQIDRPRGTLKLTLKKRAHENESISWTIGPRTKRVTKHVTLESVLDL